jgi:hypothetical protein
LVAVAGFAGLGFGCVLLMCGWVSAQVMDDLSTSSGERLS